MKRYNILALAVLIVAFVISCKKSTEIITPPPMGHFTGLSSGSYAVDSPGRIYKIPVARNDASTQGAVTVSITSPTGAVEGTQYTVNKKTFDMAVGQAVDTLIIYGNQAQYLTGRKDSLIISITQPDPADYLPSTFVLKMTGPCFEGSVELPDLAGTYGNTKEYDSTGAYSYGPYNVQLTDLTSTGATTATGKLVNLYDDGWNDIPVNLDWSDPANLKVDIPMSNTGKSYGGSGQPTYVVSSGTGDHTFSYCHQTFTISIDLVETGVIILHAYQFRLKR